MHEPRLCAPARVQHHAQDAVDAEPTGARGGRRSGLIGGRSCALQLRILATSVYPTRWTPVRPLVLFKLSRGRLIERGSDRGFELVEGAFVVAHRLNLAEGRFSIRALGVEEVEQSQSTSPVRKFNGISRLPSLRKIDFPKPANLFPLRRRDRPGCVDLRQSLYPDRPAHCTRALDLRFSPRDLSLIPVEDANRQADPEAERVVILDPLIFKQRRDVPPGVRPSQIHVGLRLLEGRLRRAEVWSVHDGQPVEIFARERHVAKGELPDDLELISEDPSSDETAQGDLCRLYCLRCVRGIALKSEAL